MDVDLYLRIVDSDFSIVDSRFGLAVTGFDTSLRVTGSLSHSTLSFICFLSNITSVQIPARAVVCVHIPFAVEIAFSIISLPATSLLVR